MLFGGNSGKRLWRTGTGTHKSFMRKGKAGQWQCRPGRLPDFGQAPTGSKPAVFHTGCVCGFVNAAISAAAASGSRQVEITAAH
jgi:hypothetical protein